jgi:hypothetical protein
LNVKTFVEASDQPASHILAIVVVVVVVRRKSMVNVVKMTQV